MKNIINSELYQKAIKEIKSVANIEVDLDYDDSLSMFDESRLAKANIDANSILLYLEINYNKIISFCLSKLSKYDSEKMDEEYPEGEDADNEDDNEIQGSYSVSFLLMYLIEYYLLKEKPNDLLTYLKAVRIPHASKYEKELKEIYSKL